MPTLQFWKPLLAILLLWVLIVFWIAPWGSYPLNDDWTYARQVLTFLESGSIENSSWAAMPFLPQSFFGIALTKIFGFSFIVLRIGTLCVAVLNAVLLYRLLRSRSKMTGTAIILTIVFIFNPIYFYLSMTFMTEVYYLFLLLVSLNLMEKYFRKDSWGTLAILSLVSVGAVLQRQTGLILPFGFLLVILLQKEAAARQKLRAVIPFSLAFLALFIYGRWRAGTDPSHSHYSHFTDLFASLYDFRLSFFLERAGMILLYLALFTLPLLLLSSWKRKKLTSFGWIALGVGMLVITCAASTFPRNQVLFNFGIGPRLLKDTITHQNPFFPQVFYFIVFGIAAFAGLWMLYSFLARQSTPLREIIGNMRQKELGFTLLLVLSFAGYGIYMLLNLVFFDRYLLPLLLLALVFVSTHLHPTDRIRKLVFYALIGILIALNGILLHDHFRWQDLRWNAIDTAEKMGYGPKKMDAGFEYNCWYNGDPKQPHIDDIHEKGWWSVIEDDFLLSEDSVAHFTPLRYFPYDPIIGCADSLVLSSKTDEAH